MQLLSRAGRSVVSINYFNHDKLGTIYDMYLDDIIDEEDFNMLYKEITRKYGYTPLQLRSQPPVLRLIPAETSLNRWDLTKTGLLAATLITVYMTGYGLSDLYARITGMSNPYTILLGLVYTILFMGALAFHEYGHMRAARIYGVVINGPYFIPAPPIQLGFIGTLGAVITMKNLPPDKEGLARLGIAGPVYGFIAGLVISFVGIILSPVIPVEFIRPLIEKGEVSEMGFLPLILQLMLALKHVPPGYTLILHPLAFIGFVVFIVTFLNLIPIGQLDGGHIIRSYIDPRMHDLLAYALIIIFAVTGSVMGGDIGLYYISLSIILLILKLLVGRHPHPGPANQYASKHSYKYLALYVILIILTLPLPS